MNEALTRRGFLGLGVTAWGSAGLLSAGAEWAHADKSLVPSRSGEVALAVSADFPRQDSASVRDVVGASHGRFDRVKELVTARPALAKAAWDWGFGDWETPLGAASHMGRRDIAEFLIAHGARPNIFALAMLGELKAVRAMVEAIPGIQSIPGPHDITLLQHAQNRLRHELSAEEKSRVAAVVAYLEGLGDADPSPTQLTLTETEAATFIGTYRFGRAANDTLVVATDRRGRLTLARGDDVSRRLIRVETNAFAPAGASEVRVRFAVTDGQASTITVHDPMPIVKAHRA